MNRFVLDWMKGCERATRLLPRDGTEALQPGTVRDGRPVPDGLVEAIESSNRAWGIVPDLDAWSRGESLVIIAGQQVGFAGGPLYTLAKLATLVRLKRDLETQGLATTIFFWLATEDHDLDEVAMLNLPVSTIPQEKEVNRQLDLLRLRAARTSNARSIVGSLPVPEPLIARLLSLYDIPRPAWLREGITFRDSFAELIASVFGNEIVLVDAMLPELRRAGASLFEQIRSRHDEIQDALSHRAEELVRAGYDEQVIPRDGNEYTLLFDIDESGRRLPESRGQRPERTSTSALTRPLLQDFALQPHIFVGGPAEVSYYAQIAPLHALLGISMPRVALRGHVLVAPKLLVRALERYGIDPANVFATADQLLADREPEGVARVRTVVSEAKRDLFTRIEEIGELALPADHALAGSIERTIGHLEYHFDKLAERAVKGLVRRDRERYLLTRDLVATLYPDRQVQDRVVSWFAYWCIHGPDLVQRVIENVEPDTCVFNIVEV